MTFLSLIIVKFIKSDPWLCFNIYSDSTCFLLKEMSCILLALSYSMGLRIYGIEIVFGYLFRNEKKKKKERKIS